MGKRMDEYIEVFCSGASFKAPQVDCGEQIRLNRDGMGFNLTMLTGVTCDLGCSSGESIPPNITCTDYGWNYNDGDYYCHIVPNGPTPKDQIIIVVFLIFIVAAITSYQYHSKNAEANNA